MGSSESGAGNSHCSPPSLDKQQDPPASIYGISTGPNLIYLPAERSSAVLQEHPPILKPFVKKKSANFSIHSCVVLSFPCWCSPGTGWDFWTLTFAVWIFWSARMQKKPQKTHKELPSVRGWGRAEQTLINFSFFCLFPVNQHCPVSITGQPVPFLPFFFDDFSRKLQKCFQLAALWSFLEVPK